MPGAGSGWDGHPMTTAADHHGRGHDRDGDGVDDHHHGRGPERGEGHIGGEEEGPAAATTTTTTTAPAPVPAVEDIAAEEDDDVVELEPVPDTEPAPSAEASTTQPVVEVVTSTPAVAASVVDDAIRVVATSDDLALAQPVPLPAVQATSSQLIDTTEQIDVDDESGEDFGTDALPPTSITFPNVLDETTATEGTEQHTASPDVEPLVLADSNGLDVDLPEVGDLLTELLADVADPVVDLFTE